MPREGGPSINPEDSESAQKPPEMPAEERDEASAETETPKEIEAELTQFDRNLAEVDKVTAEFESPQEMAGLANDLTADQRRQIEAQIEQLQRNAASHKYSAATGLSLAFNPKDAIDFVTSKEPSIDTPRFARFVAYASGGMAVVGLDEFLRNGTRYLRDKHKLRKLEKERRKLGDT